LGRVINLETAGKERNRLSKSIVIALRKLSQQKDIDSETRDLAAYIAIALHAIAETIDKTVEPWEKRGYWVKADRFRIQWSWAEIYGTKMDLALIEEDWPAAALASAAVSEKLSNVNVSTRHRMGTPWIGAWKKFSEINNTGV